MKKFYIKKFKREIELEEVLLDKLVQEKEELGVFNRKMEKALSLRILKFIKILFFVIILFLMFRTFQIQVLQHKNYQTLAHQNEFIFRSFYSQRGVIYDRYLNQLVFNKSNFILICKKDHLPQSLSERERIIKKVSRILNTSFEKLKEKIESSKNSEIVIDSNLDHKTLILLHSQIDKLFGFEIKSEEVREYKEGEIFSHLIGYERKTGEKRGLEKYYDEVLKPKPGKIQIKRNAKGEVISKQIISYPQPGKSLVLHLDSQLQKKLTESLKKILNKVGAKAAASVALDPQTGGVLAMVSLPSFDNNLFSQGITEKEWKKLQSDPLHPLFNRAISGIGYPTGSVIKPLIGLAALEEGIIKPDQKIFCPLKICLRNRWHPEREDCYSDWKYHGWSDLKRAIAESINTYFYQVGGGYKSLKGLGAKKIKEWLKIFGWGEKTGIDLPEEGEGILPEINKDWRIGDTYHFSIGQGSFSITPLQVATAFVGIANGGIIYKPHIVQKIIDSQKNVIKEIKPQILKVLPVKKENLEVIREGMRQAITTPASPSSILNTLPVSCAAKTGTAQTGREGVYHNWVVVFAPYENPKIVLVVIVENVKGMKFAALPVAKEVLEWYFKKEDSKTTDRF